MRPVDFVCVQHEYGIFGHPANPIITSARLPYSANTVFKPVATMLGGETVLLMRVEDRCGLSEVLSWLDEYGSAGDDWMRDSPTFASINQNDGSGLHFEQTRWSPFSTW